MQKKRVLIINLHVQGLAIAYHKIGFVMVMMIASTNKMSKTVLLLYANQINLNVQIRNSVFKKITNVMEYQIVMMEVMNWVVVSIICTVER